MEFLRKLNFSEQNVHQVSNGSAGAHFRPVSWIEMSNLMEEMIEDNTGAQPTRHKSSNKHHRLIQDFGHYVLLALEMSYIDSEISTLFCFVAGSCCLLSVHTQSCQFSI